MSRQVTNWLIIVAVLAVAVINPIYRLQKGEPIVTEGLDLRGGVEVLLRAVPEDGSEPDPKDMDSVKAVVRNRVDPQGQKEIYLTSVGTDRLLLQVPGESDPDSVISVIGETAYLEFINTGNQSMPRGTEFNIDGSKNRKDEYAKYEQIFDGSDLQSASVGFDQMNKPCINFELKQDAAEAFGSFTNNHIGQYLTVLLDGTVITSPSINSAIWGGSGQITGEFSQEEAHKLATQLNAGALPIPLEILQSSVVGPTLGQASIDKSYRAGLLGFLIVLALVIVFYRLPGVVASVALATYVVLVLGYFSLFNATMTLPGIAAFILSIGMAIDGNVIIFERLKEELRWGKTLRAAIEAAFARAWVAIIDGNATTFIGAVVLFWFGSGPVKGFAITLALGIILSLFSAVFVTRTMLEALSSAVRNEKLYG
ncbi:MAG: protein translocase subunit SecD [Planctomycetales bacterium]|nr:protein translocase subunit SecD [bacterium]UNM07898.1 MAG: protein translocase subunit SecD [Planctomycetales bacterium]